MRIKVVFYGGLRYEVGHRDFLLESTDPQSTLLVADVLVLVVEKFPALAGRLDKVAVSVGSEIVGREHVVRDGDEVCLLPPVSGGSGGTDNQDIKQVRHLSAEILDLNELLAETEDPACGGLVIFSGDIRNHNDGRSAVAITYEAHDVLAAQVLGAIEREVLARFGARQCRIQHRTGRVNVGESSVLVVVRAAHRAAAFEGARYAIDELKERVPIWKEEHYKEGDSRFLDGVPLREGPKS